MDDMFGMLVNNSLSPERKLLAAITTGMSDSVQILIKEGKAELVNAVLQQQNGRASLHIACQTGRHTYIEWLVAAGACSSQLDFFGMTPVELASRSGHELCVREILSASCDVNPSTLWTSQTRSGAFAWQAFSDRVISEMMIATPDLSRYPEAMRILCRDCFRNPEKYELIIKVYLLSGNELPVDDRSEIMKLGHERLTRWMELRKAVPASMQHISRVAVRRNLQPNVYYAAKLLPLPQRLQKYLVLAGDNCTDSDLL